MSLLPIWFNCWYLNQAIDARDLAHKEFVDATVDYTLAGKVLTSATETKDKADKSLKDAETIMSDAEKVVSNSNKNDYRF